MKNANNHDRGLHIAIINPITGTIEVSRIFDTFHSSSEIDKFIKAGVPDNYIVVAACKDDCVTNMSETVRKWFFLMGS